MEKIPTKNPQKQPTPTKNQILLSGIMINMYFQSILITIGINTKVYKLIFTEIIQPKTQKPSKNNICKNSIFFN